MYRPLLLLTALALASPALAQTVKLPAEVRVQPGRLAPVRIEFDGDEVRWDVPAELDAFREYSPDPKDVRLRVQGWTKGAYRIVAVACKGGKLSEFAACVVTVGDAPPPAPPGPTPPGPTPPGPTPPPVPPVPPTPVPPDDPAAQRLKDAFKRDADAIAEKLAHCATLSAFFVAMASHVKDPSVKTVGDLLADYRAAVPAVLKPGALPLVRKQIAAEVAAVTGDDPERDISPDLRDKLIKLFEFLALILKLLS